MVTQEIKPNFSNLQLELLKLYSTGVSDEQLVEIKLLLSNYFINKATSAMDSIISANELTQQDIILQSKEHHRCAHRS